MTYDADHFIKKFESIPEEKWASGNFVDPHNGGMCALGHCGARFHSAMGEEHTDESKALSRLFRKHNLEIAAVNDGITVTYAKGIHPKTRVISALKTIKEST